MVFMGSEDRAVAGAQLNACTMHAVRCWYRLMELFLFLFESNHHTLSDDNLSVFLFVFLSCLLYGFYVFQCYVHIDVSYNIVLHNKLFSGVVPYANEKSDVIEIADHRQARDHYVTFEACTLYATFMRRHYASLLKGGQYH